MSAPGESGLGFSSAPGRNLPHLAERGSWRFCWVACEQPLALPRRTRLDCGPTVQTIVRRPPSEAGHLPSIHLRIHALGAMMDELTRKLFTGSDAELRKLIGFVSPDDERLANALSIV